MHWRRAQIVDGRLIVRIVAGYAGLLETMHIIVEIVSERGVVEASVEVEFAQPVGGRGSEAPPKVSLLRPRVSMTLSMTCHCCDV